MTQKTGENDKYIFFKSINFEHGWILNLMLNKVTNEVYFDANDVSRCLGLGETIRDFLSTDDGLDTISEFKKEFPDRPIIGKNGMLMNILP